MKYMAISQVLKGNFVLFTATGTLIESLPGRGIVDPEFRTIV